MGLGGWEIFLIFLVVLLLFGAKRLPEIARSMGNAVNEFKKAKNEAVKDIDPNSNSAGKDALPKDGVQPQTKA